MTPKVTVSPRGRYLALTVIGLGLMGSSCLGVETTYFSFGLICPPGMACDSAHGQCVLAAQLTACEGKLDDQTCNFPGAPPLIFRCHLGVCLPLEQCGNGILEPGEDCEATVVSGLSCQDVGYADPGVLGCSDQCDFDTSGCVAVCGNGVVEPCEFCDDLNATDGDGCDSQCRIEACVVFVDGDPEILQRDGLSWFTAYATVQEAIDDPAAVVPDCEIWVAAGTYHIYQTSVHDTLTLRPRVEIYGGFVGDEYLREQRDWEVNPTTLDGASEGDSSLRVLHVVRGSSAARLDGFAIIHGRADGPDDADLYGGGVLIVDGNENVIIANCRISECEARNGAGFAARNSLSLIVGCVFRENSAIERGGGLAYLNGASVTVVDSDLRDNLANEGGGFAGWAGGQGLFRRCRILNNEVTYLGGGAFNNAPLWLEDCSFESNSANSGGGMVNMGDSDPTTVVRCDFLSNSVTTYGAGMHNDSCSPSIIESTFAGNQLAQFGGGMYNGNADVQIDRCLFRANGASRGGAIYSDLSFPQISNTVFWENWALYYGAALSAFRTTVVSVANATFYDNDCGGSGGVVFNRSGAQTDLTNCILWDNKLPLFTSDGGSATTNYSIVQGGTPGTGNLNADPLLADPAIGDFTLLAGSPAIDSADGSAAPPLDSASQTRCDDPATPNTGTGTPTYTDRGAYEYQAPDCD